MVFRQWEEKVVVIWLVERELEGKGKKIYFGRALLCSSTVVLYHTSTHFHTEERTR